MLLIIRRIGALSGLISEDFQDVRRISQESHWMDPSIYFWMRCFGRQRNDQPRAGHAGSEQLEHQEAADYPRREQRGDQGQPALDEVAHRRAE